MLALIFLIIFANRLSSKLKSKITLNMFDECVPLNEKGNFYSNYILDYNTGKDIRLYGLENSLLNIVKNYFKDCHDLGSKSQKKFFKFEILENINSNILQVVAYIFVMLACIKGSVPIGSIIMYVGCVTRFINSIGEIVFHSQILIDNNKYLEHYFKFLDIPSKMHQGIMPVVKDSDNKYEIEFKNVSFKYPESKNYALKNLSMKINRSQKLAIVGMNGSGKTTMIKLLCRLYDPTDGEITLNDINIKEYDYNEYMNIFSIVFQDFKLFSFPLDQNVATSVDINEQWVEKCLLMAGLDERLKTLPKKSKTPLYKNFEEDGIEISGGEAQKIALARALYKNAPFIVLDEPTAALDPIAEFEIYSKFNEIVGDKTAIYISHRLSSCRFCDDIAVFHEGELIQRGGHDTLIADASGKYYELWNAQAQYYMK